MQRIKKVGFTRMRDIWFDEESFSSAKEKIVVLHSNTILDSSLYDYKMTGKTFVIDLSRDKEEIFASLDSKSCRYMIRRAQRDGIHVWKAESRSEKMLYLEYQNAFCREKEIPEVKAEELDDLEVYCAETREKEFLGGCAFILSDDQKTVRYKYGATAHKMSANEAILWEAICAYHERGFINFDMGGCIPIEDKTSYYYSHYQFKKKFGGKLTDSFNYMRFRGVWKAAYIFAGFIIKYFFKGDINGFVIWLNKHKIMK